MSDRRNRDVSASVCQHCSVINETDIQGCFSKMLAVSIMCGNGSVSDQWGEMNYSVNNVGEIGWQFGPKNVAPH
jgi:hypothetical protein